MTDQLYFRVFTTIRSIWRRKMAKWQLYKYHPKQRVCMDWVDRPKNYKGFMEFCNFCKVPISTIFHRKLLNLVGQLFIHQHFSFNVQIFNLIDIRNLPQCPHGSAMGYCCLIFWLLCIYNSTCPWTVKDLVTCQQSLKSW